MARYLRTKGLPYVAVGICDRCKLKVPYAELRPDGNLPGLRVCQRKGCWDQFDPWRLPARKTEDITLPNPRPDEPLYTPPSQEAPTAPAILLESGGDLLLESGGPILLEA